MGGLFGEGGTIEALQEAVRLQFVEQFCCLAFDVLGKAKRIATLEYANSTCLAGPLVDILKQVMMDGLVVSEVEVPCGKWFAGPRARYFRLERTQLRLLAQIE